VSDRPKRFTGTLSAVFSVPGCGTILSVTAWSGNVRVGQTTRIGDLTLQVSGWRCWVADGKQLPSLDVMVTGAEIDQLELLVGQTVTTAPEAVLPIAAPQVSSSGLSRGPSVPQAMAIAGGTLGPRHKAWDDSCGVKPSEAICQFPADMPCRRALRKVSGLFADAGIESPELDARWLVQGVLGVTHAELISRADCLLGGHADAVADAANRRMTGEPLSRILGTQEFYGREFALSPATLDPRADTETLIDVSLKIADAEGGRQRPLRILDLGTGTGCLLLTLLAELPHATGIGCDISAEAVATAASNARRLGVADRSEFVVADMLSPGFGSPGFGGPFDLIISNPPYIPSAVVAGLERHVRDFDPLAALDGGADGLRFYRALVSGFAALVPDGWLVLEIGYDQAEAVQMLLEAARGPARWSTPKVTSDLGHNPRCVAVRTRDRTADQKKL
jgi:release factor glutamine methyltransferase